ncbi:hypothetical protein JTB14_012182 [Gonioctena quinquepunctata]|nr:hypothetical protein JTB14_012182 [Gonioctena quinquepunctata]
MPEIVDDNDDADSDATIEDADEQNYDVNINDEAPMELNDEFFEYLDLIFQQFDDEELGGDSQDLEELLLESDNDELERDLQEIDTESTGTESEISGLDFVTHLQFWNASENLCSLWAYIRGTASVKSLFQKTFGADSCINNIIVEDWLV